MTEPCDLSAVELRRLIGAKALSPVELLESCIERIEAVNPAVNAVVEVNLDRARQEARDAERQVLRGEALGALHGLPVGIKDLTETAGMRTTFGSVLYKDNVPARDERLVAAIRQAGGIVFAKTNTPEFGAGANTRNEVYGKTVNPFDRTRICGGSSGGSAVALACSMMPLASGSDMGGSLRIPAGFCGVVGLRPTPGLVPSERRLSGASGLSVNGPMARNVADAALLLSVMAADDAGDPLSAPVDAAGFRSPPPVDLSTLRVAVSEDLGFAPVDDRIRAVFRARCGAFADLFKSSVERDPDLKTADATFGILRAEEFVASHAGRYAERRDELGPNIRANMEEALSLSIADTSRAHVEHTRTYREFQRLFQDVDLLICPTTAVTPFPVEQWYQSEINGIELKTYYHWFAITYGLTLTQHPVVSLPCGVDHEGMPFGLQICGPRRGDAFVLAAVAALEREFARRPALLRPIPNLQDLARGAA